MLISMQRIMVNKMNYKCYRWMKIKCADKINGKQSHIYHFVLVWDSKRKIQINNSYHIIVNDFLEISFKMNYSHLKYLYSPFPELFELALFW